jgi:hypothetical protein
MEGVMHIVTPGALRLRRVHWKDRAIAEMSVGERLAAIGKTAEGIPEGLVVRSDHPGYIICWDFGPC